MNFQHKIKEFSDIIVYYTACMVDLNDHGVNEKIFADMIYFLIECGYNSEEVLQLNYTLRKSKDIDELYEIKANNITTALWFSNVYPDEIPLEHETEVTIDGVDYTFNKNQGTIKKHKNAARR